LGLCLEPLALAMLFRFREHPVKSFSTTFHCWPLHSLC
jgi:hypothetical protein